MEAVQSPTIAIANRPSAADRHLAAAATLAARIAEASDIATIIDAVLDGVRDGFGFANTMLLLKEPSGARPVTVGSRGYAWSGVGSEVAVGEAVIGTAAAERCAVRISDMSRIRRFGSAIRPTSADENRTRTIALPGLADAMSQLALPMIAGGSLRGVLFLESAERLAFSRDVEAVLSMVAVMRRQFLPSRSVSDMKLHSSPRKATAHCRGGPSTSFTTRSTIAFSSTMNT